MRVSYMTPDYERLLQSHIYAVKVAYNDYKKALVQWLDLTFITDDGTIGYYDSDLGKQVDEFKKIYQREVLLLQAFKIKYSDELPVANEIKEILEGIEYV